AAASAPSTQEWRETKYVKAPEIFNPKSIEEEISMWPEWAFSFKNFMAIQDDEYRGDFAKAETSTEFLAFEDYGPAIRARSLRLYSILASYLKGRALKILRAEPKGDGFSVWRQLKEELQPTSRPRVLALAQALTRFPPLKEGASVLEYTLGYERLITEYEKLSSARYPEDLKISTLMSGLPQDIKRYLQLQIDDSTTYNGLRSTLLQFERTAATWSTEHVLKAIGVDKDSPLHPGNGPVPMDVDRVEQGKPKGSWKGKKGDVGKDKGKKGKGDKGSWNSKGYDQAKGYKGYGNFKGNVKGKFGGGKGKEKGKKSFGKGFGSPGGKGKGPCFICGRMGHRAAECHLRVRRLEFAHDVLMEEIFDETEAGEVGEPLWESHVHDLSWYDSEEVWEEGWDEYDGFGGYVRMVAEIVEPAEHELLEDVQSECGSSCSLPSTSTLHFSLCDEDEVDSPCELESGAESDWVLLQQARAEEAEFCVRAVAEGHEVILDSGADVTVLPMHIFGEVGIEDHASVSLVDAQGSIIPQAAVREGVTFVVKGCDGSSIVFKDKAVLARVKQPLLCAGKLIRDGWLPRPDSENLVMAKGSQAFPLHWARNSIAATMKIFRTEEAQVRMVVELGESFVNSLKRRGWQLNENGQPTHVSNSSSTTTDPSEMYDPEVFAHRTTLVQQSGRRYTVFECGEYWEPKPVMEIGGSPTKVITILTTQPVEPESLGKVVAEDVAIVPRFPRPAPGDDGGSGQADQEVAGAEDEPRQSIGAPVLGPELTVVPDVGEVVKLGEKELREESSLRDLRWGCKFLRIPHTGPKATLWDRLKKEVAMNQLKVAVQASDAVVEAYTPDVNHGPLPVKPDP
ncbi:unnamed protein product, partial [Symbiodinium necroappetens]